MTDRFIVGLTLGRWQTNGYVVGDSDLGTAVVIDPGDGGASAVPAALDELAVRCEAILVTHGHIDHLWAAPDLARSLDVPVHLHADDAWLWEDPGVGVGLPPGAAAEHSRLRWDPPDERVAWLRQDTTLSYAGISFDVRHTPGHTPGHVTYLGRGLAGVPVTFALAAAAAGTDATLFSGDLVFAGSIGRTDFPRGSTEQMFRSLAATVLPLEDDTLILSGHGPDTTVGRERTGNPFLAHAAASVRGGAG